MDQYLIMILIFIIGVLVGGYIHRQTMTTPESREVDRQHIAKNTLYLEEQNKEIDKIIKQYDDLSKRNK